TVKVTVISLAAYGWPGFSLILVQCCAVSTQLDAISVPEQLSLSGCLKGPRLCEAMTCPKAAPSKPAGVPPTIADAPLNGRSEKTIASVTTRTLIPRERTIRLQWTGRGPRRFKAESRSSRRSAYRCACAPVVVIGVFRRKIHPPL